MTPEQYNKLKNHEPTLRNYAATAGQMQELSGLYLEITGKHLNMRCSNCVKDMFVELNYLLKEYENNRP